MTSRSNAKPTHNERLWPLFAAGWTGSNADPVPCADCGEPAFVGREPSDPERAEVAHIDPTRQSWSGNVAIACRTCNRAHGNAPQPHLEALQSTPEALQASRDHVATRDARNGAERARRDHARRARRARRA